eukprot:1871675-Rhodomonas_salina.4
MVQLGEALAENWHREHLVDVGSVLGHRLQQTCLELPGTPHGMLVSKPRATQEFRRTLTSSRWRIARATRCIFLGGSSLSAL